MGPSAKIAELLRAAADAVEARMWDQANAQCARVFALAPNNAVAWHLMGVSRHGSGNRDGAIEAFLKAVEYDPDNAPYRGNLGALLMDADRLIDARVQLSASLEADPNYAAGWVKLGALSRREGDTDDAERSLRRALELAPADPQANNNLGNLLRDQGRIDEAITVLQSVIETVPAWPEPRLNLAKTLEFAERWNAARSIYETLLFDNPKNLPARYNLSLLQLRMGDYAAGWNNFETRWGMMTHPLAKRRWAAPRWTGEPLDAKALLIHAEQGFGDTIQFVRFVKRLADQAADIWLEVQAELVELIQLSIPNIRVIAWGDELPAHDFQIPLLSLPAVLGIEEADIKPAGPYLQPGLVARQIWAERIPAKDGTRNVGLVWSGNPTQANDRNRSCPLSVFAPLVQIPGIRWFSLQKTHSTAQITNHERLKQLTDLSPWLGDFQDTAAAVSQLDLVISVDTATAHLTGALGCPLCLLIPVASDWRWGTDTCSTPWYPTARIFRQTEFGNWDGVAGDLGEMLGS